MIFFENIFNVIYYSNMQAQLSKLSEISLKVYMICTLRMHGLSDAGLSAASGGAHGAVRLRAPRFRFFYGARACEIAKSDSINGVACLLTPNHV